MSDPFLVQADGPSKAERAPPSRVVAIGASAGGLEALQHLFSHMPDNTGMCFVVAQHLSPDFKSLMPELLGRTTRLPVVAADRDLPLLADTVYVLTPGVSVSVCEDRMVTQPRATHGELYHPINLLFESLAPMGARAAVVVLSGTGQDGMAGAQVVRKSGGLVLAQVPTSARFDSMPRAVIDAGLADIVALPAEMGRALALWCADPEAGRCFTSEAADGDSLDTGPYGPVLRVLQEAFDIDFSHYKAGTIMRRIDRWLAGNGKPISPEQLAENLQGNTSGLERLFADLLIGVTSFFRDATEFELLRQHGIEPMIDALGERDSLRIWSCACSTGEEAYSVAILALEAFSHRNVAPRVRVLATDLHAASVQKASAGLYSQEALAGLPEALRDKYFAPQASGLYKVAEHLRRTVVFSVHNVLRDAPFQRIDLVVCRNMLIYLKPPAQAQVLAGFHTALHSGGLLFLGKSEQPTEQSDAFAPMGEAGHMYRKRPGLQLPISARPLFGLPPALRPSASVSLDSRASFRLQEVLAQRYVPSGFLVNQSDELVYVFGNAGKHLQAAPGRFGGTMFSLLGGPLRTAVTMALRKAAQNLDSTSVSNVLVDENAPEQVMRVEVDPIIDRTLPLTYYLVRLVPQVSEVARSTAPLLSSPDAAATQHMLELELELQRTREALQRSVEDLEAANEELQAGNEELMAANEELQSSNEELHALNEELYSVNAEHELKIQELRETSADLNNLIRATELPIIFLDLEARLRMFTPAATEMFRLRPQDIGRELRDFLPQEPDDSLFEDIKRCLLDGRVVDIELELSDERVLRRRVAPYRTDMGITNGLVLTYMDVTQQVRNRLQALRLENQAQVQAIIESVPQLMWSCTADGLCDFFNPQWAAYTGLAAELQLGNRWMEQVHPDDRPELSRAWHRSVTTGQALHTRYRIRRHDGQYRWFDVQGTPQRDSQGRIRKWYGSNTDVHEVHLLQQALEERERFTQLVADHINGLVSYWDLQQRNRFANRQHLDWLGKAPAQILGLSLREVLGDGAYAQQRHHLEAALRGQVQEFTRSVDRPDGGQRHLLTQYWPHEVDGKVQGVVATATDVTRLQEARMLTDHIFEVSTMAKLIVDDTGHIVRWNPAAHRLLGYAADQMAGLSVDQLVPPAVRARHGILRAGYMMAPRPRPMGTGRALSLLRADGTQVDVEVDLSNVQLEGRQAVIAMVREVTLSEDAVHRLDLAEQARGAFLAQMSHEIRTPLNAILGMSQLLELEAPTPKQLDRLRRIEEASHHLLGIVNDILDYSKVQAGGLHLEREAIDLSTLLDRSLSLVAEKARTKHLDLQVQVSDEVPRQLVGDGRRVEQILVNLLSNAVKFTHNGGVTVAVSSSTASDSRVVLQVEVIDTGIGIAPEEISQLFTPFRQLRQGHARPFGGTGLGLSISRQLARAMNGDCGVRSVPGRGSTFWFTAQLELAQGSSFHPRSTAPAPVASAPTRGHAGRCVMLVEDNEINRVVVRELLKKVADVQVVEAVDGLQSLELARQRSVDLVLMDIQMPCLDGLQATRQMRLLPGYDKVPIYALSANVHADDVNACLAAGMTGHLGKPLAVSQLQALVRGLWGPPGDAPAASGAPSPA